MMGLLIVVHLIVCVLLIGIILIQAGRGGGLVDSFSGVESMFGTKTNAFLTRTTTVLSVMFFITCLSLALLSARQSRSLMKEIKTQKPAPASLPQGQLPAQGIQAQNQPTVNEQQAPKQQEPPKTK